MSEEYDGPTDRSDTNASLVAQLELLDVENTRLRERLAEARRTRHRRAATALAVMGTMALGSGILFPVARDVLFALGGTGLFAAVLIVYLTPERFVSADIGERVYEALEVDRSALIEELELRNEQVYLPVDSATGTSARLFVPQHRDFTRPRDEELTSLFVTPSNELARGVAFEPTGSALSTELENTMQGGFAAEPAVLANQLVDGLVESFELVESAWADTEEGRISIAINESAYGPVDRLDHPISSTVGSTLTTVLAVPVTVEVTTASDADYVITGRWE